MPSLSFRCLALFTIALSSAGGVAAQSGRNAPPVRIDFRALTDEGQPVTDLKPAELTLKVNGKPRQIRSLTLLETGGAKASEPQLPPPYATNLVGHGGRAFHILIDDDSIAPGREAPVKEAVHLLLSELAPDDRVGVLTPQGQVNIRPGDDRPKVQAALDAFVGRGSQSETDTDAACRTTRTLAALGTMVSLAGSSPTTIIVFSAGMTPPTQNVVNVGSKGAAGRTAECQVRPEDLQELGALVAMARTDLYLFHVIEGMVNRSSTQDSGFESLAGATGAAFVRLSGNAQPAVARLLRETTASYVATFDPEEAERNGQALRLELKTARDGIKLRTHSSVVIPKTIAAKAPSPKDMLRVQTEYRDLPLRAAGYTSRIAGSDDVKIVAMFEAGDDSAPLSSASIGLFDEKNTLKKQWTAQPADLAKRSIIAALSAPPGRYRLRAAAVDGSGRAGTADYDITAELTRADPLKLSALVLGAQAGGGFAPRLQFGAEPIAIGYLEMYGVPKGGAVTVDLDVVATPEGAPLAMAATTVGAGSSEDMRVAFGGFDIASLPAGDYLMRAIVSLDGKPVGKVVRTLRKK